MAGTYYRRRPQIRAEQQSFGVHAREPARLLVPVEIINRDRRQRQRKALTSF